MRGAKRSDVVVSYASSGAPFRTWESVAAEMGSLRGELMTRFGEPICRRVWG